MIICRNCGKAQAHCVLELCKKCYGIQRYHLNKDRLLAYQNNYYNLNKDEILAYQRKYYSLNKDKISIHKKKYCNLNKDQISARKKNYRKLNRDKILARKKNYRKLNRDKISARQKNRYRNGEINSVRIKDNKTNQYWVYNTSKKVHTAIAEKVLGRRLMSNECVHHIDGNGLNNLHSNLLICTRSLHTGLHNRMKKTGKKT